MEGADAEPGLPKDVMKQTPMKLHRAITPVPARVLTTEEMMEDIPPRKRTLSGKKSWRRMERMCVCVCEELDDNRRLMALTELW